MNIVLIIQFFCFIGNDLTCPATWDGWYCFNRTKPGQIIAKCPNYIFGDLIRHDLDKCKKKLFILIINYL